MVNRPVTQYDRPPGQPRRNRGGRRAKKVFIILGILVLVLVGADFGLAAIAEHTVSQKAREQLKLSDDPSVTIHGFPFSTQAIGGDYSHISIQASGVKFENKLRDVAISAELRDVTAPLSDLINGNTNAIKIGTLEGQIKIKGSDIARIEPLTQIKDFRIESASEQMVKSGEEAKPDETTTTTPDKSTNQSSAGVKISGNLNFGGNHFELTCYAMIEIDGTKIHITPERVELGNDSVPNVVGKAVSKLLVGSLKTTIDTGTLPFQVKPTSVKVEDGGVTLNGEAKGVTFAGVKGTGETTGR
ncbi:LmeA family phospholipid-binding protein [Amycolatopsis sp. CA-230715]|uniref:LmeA family phospholipid-binding protein n=1 Tax=Amycolatopsis sp. CA-230715 TaxID=2745196 RepID=UPI001C033F15|nr:DUF2993 domain-containing protein [Amycolatopsis sp. CA-230715]